MPPRNRKTSVWHFKHRHHHARVPYTPMYRTAEGENLLSPTPAACLLMLLVWPILYSYYNQVMFFGNAPL